MKLSQAEILNLRYQFEEITQNYNMPNESDIDTIIWFIEEGYKSNSLRDGFNEAMEIAETIRGQYGSKNKKITRGIEI
tara:strand:- start:12314 stop:12547 length:234 start_codon:yes stop_codon:yes gene_type:complete